ncbi:MAG: glycosyltransferase family 4 protein, partial [Nanopusillaceae archaeon]
VKIHALNPMQYRIYKYLGFKNVYLIPNFLETVKIKNIKENLDEFIVCYIGRIDPKHKGIDILIEVMKKTLEKNKNIKFYIGGIGDKEFEKQLKELENNYPNNVKYLGRVSDEEKFELLSKSSIFVLPSRWESGFPTLAFGEATSEGNICLLSNIPAHKYILNLENKFGFICKNVEDYVNKILELYDFWKNNKKEFLEWRKYIQKRAIELFSLEKIVKEFEEKLLN